MKIIKTTRYTKKNYGGVLLGKFIDFDKKKGMFYDNIWLDEQKIVIKMPLTRKNYSDKHPNLDFRIEKFSLEDTTYLLAYD